MSDSKSSKSLTDSPTNATTGLVKNVAGSMPPKMDFEAIQRENTPPSTPAKNSTDSLGHQSR